MAARWVREVPRAAGADAAHKVLAELEGKLFESAVDIAVCDGEQLVGLAPIERLLAADPATRVGDLIGDRAPIKVAEGDDLETAAAQAARKGARTVAVVDRSGKFLGLVPPEELLATLNAEHEEDILRLSGSLAGATRARSAAEERVPRRLWHRLPWLLLGLAGAMASAGIVASFEEELQTQLLLAFFLPAVVYMADAVGTQTEAIVIRGISVGVPARHVIGRELTTGLIMGALVAAIFFPFAQLVWGDADVAATVALALLASCSMATIVAMVLPYGLNKAGRDPAFGSGPLATVVQDLLSIVIYFAVGTALSG
ncbi:MAG: magnesium transporter [Gaiellaceae bacterium]